MEELLKLLEKDERVILLKEKKNQLLKDKKLIDKINKLKELDKYSNEYKKIKIELFNVDTFVEFKQLENEINLLILEINNKLKELTE